MKTKAGLLLSISAALACCYLLIQPLAASATGVENSSRGEATAAIAMANPAAAFDYLPDLVINQTEVVPNDDNKLRVHVVNIGNADAGPCNMKLFYRRSGKQRVVGTLVPAIAKGHGVWVFVDIKSPMKAASSIWLRVDDPNRLKESDEGNNSYQVKSETDEAQLPSGTNLRPDLAIIRVAGTPGNKKAIRVRVANLGNAASLPCTLTLEIFESNDFKNPVEIMDKAVPALEPRHGEWILIEVETEFDLSNAKNRITALRPFRLTVDSKNENPESNENNNRMQFHVAP